MKQMAYESLRAQRQKRALNIVWTAAGNYGFRPEFLAFHQNGEPDLYLNSIVGLVHRHYDSEKLTAYLRETLDKSLLGGLFTELFWLGLEEAAYLRELLARPVLRDLRRRHAERFLAEDTDLFFQQLMMRQELVHNLKCARCREILGQKAGLLNPWDKKLYGALRFTGDMNTEELIAAMEDIIRKFFRFHWYSAPRKVLHFDLSPGLKALLMKIMPLHSRNGEEFSASHLLVNNGAAADSSKSLWPGAKATRLEAEDLAERYGPPLFAEEHRAEIEAELCRGIHSQVGLWFTGEKGAVRPENQEFFARHQERFRTELQALTQRLKNALLVYRQPMELPSRSGRLATARVWRGVVMNDARVFSATEPTAYGNFSVMLVLDASVSREGRQPIIATQAYLLAEALGQAGIPLAAVSFFSEGGCTVLRLLKDFAESSAQGIFAYMAQGWNRDGLAFRALPNLWGSSAGKKLIFILTDANPSDESEIPRQGIKPASLYGGEAAIEDTAQGIKAIKQQGFQVMALVNSVIAEELTTPVARKIYGESYICLRDLSSLAQQVGDLLEKEIV